MTNRKMNFDERSYEYKGFTIYQITKKDYCVWTLEKGLTIDALTLKEAKAEIDKMI